MGLRSPPPLYCARSCCSGTFCPWVLRPRSSIWVSCCRSRDGPTSRRTDIVSVTGARNALNCGLVFPNRGLTSYLKRLPVLSKPRTYISVGSTNVCCPHPCSLLWPCSSRSAAPRGLETEKLSVARCGRRTLSGLNEMFRFALVVHGPVHELRSARLPSCFSRHSFAEPVLLSSSERIATASAGSVVSPGS